MQLLGLWCVDLKGGTLLISWYLEEIFCGVRKKVYFCTRFRKENDLLAQLV